MGIEDNPFADYLVPPSQELEGMVLENNYKIQELITKICYLEKKVRSLEADLKDLQEKVADLK